MENGTLGGEETEAAGPNQPIPESRHFHLTKFFNSEDGKSTYTKIYRGIYT